MLTGKANRTPKFRIKRERPLASRSTRRRSLLPRPAGCSSWRTKDPCLRMPGGVPEGRLVRRFVPLVPADVGRWRSVRDQIRDQNNPGLLRRRNTLDRPTISTISRCKDLIGHTTESWAGAGPSRPRRPNRSKIQFPASPRPRSSGVPWIDDDGLDRAKRRRPVIDSKTATAQTGGHETASAVLDRQRRGGS